MSIICGMRVTAHTSVRIWYFICSGSCVGVWVPPLRSTSVCVYVCAGVCSESFPSRASSVWKSTENHTHSIVCAYVSVIERTSRRVRYRVLCAVDVGHHIHCRFCCLYYDAGFFFCLFAYVRIMCICRAAFTSSFVRGGWVPMTRESEREKQRERERESYVCVSVSPLPIWSDMSFAVLLFCRRAVAKPAPIVCVWRSQWGAGAKCSWADNPTNESSSPSSWQLKWDDNVATVWRRRSCWMNARTKIETQLWAPFCEHCNKR